MTKTVIEMAIEAELIYSEAGKCCWIEDTDLRLYLKRFAELVRAEALAAQQEPVACMQDSIELYVQDRPGASYTIPLYATPQAQRKPLTLQELKAAWNAQAGHRNQWNALCLDEMVAWAQAAHGIKENQS